MVPRTGLEPARLAPLPPQGSVYTNFTTWAYFLALLLRCSRYRRNVPGSRRGIVLDSRHLVNCFCRDIRSRNFSCILHRHIDKACTGRMIFRNHRQRQAGREKNRGEYRRRARQHIAGTAATEQGLRCAGAERCAHIGAFALLDQHQTDNAQRCQHMKNYNQCFHNSLYRRSADRDKFLSIE